MNSSVQKKSQNHSPFNFCYHVILSILLTVSLCFAGWISFEDGRIKTNVTEKDQVRCTDIAVLQKGCNLSITIPGAYEAKPDDFGLLAGNYSVFSLFGSALKIVNENISGTFRPDKLGKPNLPITRFHVLIPYSVTKDQLTISVLNAHFKPINGSWFIAPIQEQVFDSFIPGVHRDTRVFQMDKTIYEKDAFFTHPLEYDIFICHGYKILEIRYCPMKYNPVTQTVLSTNSAQFAVTYETIPVNNNIQPNNFTNTIYKTTFNGITGRRNEPLVKVSRGGKFVIVSADPLIDCPTMDEYIAYRENQGYEHVATLDASSGSSGIENKLQELYDAEKIEFVQVIGDDYLIDPPQGGDEYHYKDWANFEGGDTYEDVMLGIYLCNTETGFKQIFDRQKWHEAGGEWTKTAISTLGQQDQENPLERFSSGHYGSRNWDNPELGLGYTVHRIYKVNREPTQGYGGGYNVPGPFPWEEWALDPDPFYTSSSEACDEIYDRWNEGVFIIFHRDHGSPSGPSSPSIRMSSKVTATCSPLFLSMNCSSGDFKDNHSSNFAYLTQSKKIGTCATLAAPVTTMSGDNDLYAMAILEGLIPEDGGPPERQMGMVHIMGSLKSKSHSRKFFHNYGDVMTLLSIGDMEPMIKVMAPLEVEQNSVCKVTWSDNIDGNVSIELLKGGMVNETLADATESDGSFEWNVPVDFPIGTDYAFRITSVDSTALADTSELFPIVEEYIIDSFPHVQDFDEMGVTRPLGEKWEQLDDDDFDWIVLSGPTPSQQYESTGPEGDHTSGNGNYVYVEASDPNYPNKKTNMISPKFNLSILSDPELIFWAQMKSDSNTMGDIYIDIKVDTTWHNEVIHLTDDHGDPWFEVKQDLTDYRGERVRFRFRAVTGESWCGDMCIDDFQINGNMTSSKNVIAVLPSTFDFRYYGSRIRFQIPDTRLTSIPVRIDLYNLQGKTVKTLINKNVKAGRYSIGLDRESLSAGMYQCKLVTKGYSKVIGVLLIK